MKAILILSLGLLSACSPDHTTNQGLEFPEPPQGPHECGKADYFKHGIPTPQQMDLFGESYVRFVEQYFGCTPVIDGVESL